MRLVRFDPETETHPRDPAGHFIECGAGEAGEIICQISKADGTIVSPFEGYTNEAESRKKILSDVFETGDRWWRSGDLFRRDVDDYYYFVDRIGDTFRWKGENVSTQEVAQALAEQPEVDLCAVYGVELPGTDGRAGMAAVVLAPGATLDGEAVYAGLVETLPTYARPAFIRILDEPELTGTYKLCKGTLRAQGFDPAVGTDPVLYRDDHSRSYLPVDPGVVERIERSEVHF